MPADFSGDESPRKRRPLHAVPCRFAQPARPHPKPLPATNAPSGWRGRVLTPVLLPPPPSARAQEPVFHFTCPYWTWGDPEVRPAPTLPLQVQGRGGTYRCPTGAPRPYPAPSHGSGRRRPGPAPIPRPRVPPPGCPCVRARPRRRRAPLSRPAARLWTHPPLRRRPRARGTCAPRSAGVRPCGAVCSLPRPMSGGAASAAPVTWSRPRRLHVALYGGGAGPAGPGRVGDEATGCGPMRALQSGARRQGRALVTPSAPSAAEL